MRTHLRGSHELNDELELLVSTEGAAAPIPRRHGHTLVGVVLEPHERLVELPYNLLP